ncbi:hypothetical protein [Kitasatospora sp. NPDC051914]|uniref:hypothetical protein n=1 Tax=Kitasatospora sp. NPDC051914 TaxID=3154945 RepID=UPI0034158574
MDDIPQGGAGGVPGQHDDEQDDRRTPTVKTVRAGTPVAEQDADTEHPPSDTEKEEKGSRETD